MSTSERIDFHYHHDAGTRPKDSQNLGNHGHALAGNLTNQPKISFSGKSDVVWQDLPLDDVMDSSIGKDTKLVEGSQTRAQSTLANLLPPDQSLNVEPRSHDQSTLLPGNPSNLGAKISAVPQESCSIPYTYSSCNDQFRSSANLL